MIVEIITMDIPMIMPSEYKLNKDLIQKSIEIDIINSNIKITFSIIHKFLNLLLFFKFINFLIYHAHLLTILTQFMSKLNIYSFSFSFVKLFGRHTTDTR